MSWGILPSLYINLSHLHDSLDTQIPLPYPFRRRKLRNKSLNQAAKVTQPVSDKASIWPWECFDLYSWVIPKSLHCTWWLMNFPFFIGRIKKLFRAPFIPGIGKIDYFLPYASTIRLALLSKSSSIFVSKFHSSMLEKTRTEVWAIPVLTCSSCQSRNFFFKKPKCIFRLSLIPWLLVSAYHNQSLSSFWLYWSQSYIVAKTMRQCLVLFEAASPLVD